MKHNKIHKRAVIAMIASVCALLTASVAQGGILLQDTFEAGSRLTQDLPDTSAWYGGNTSGGAISNATNGNLTYSYTSGAWVWSLTSYFTDSGTVDLSVGEALKVTIAFEAQINALPSDNTLRIGVLNSGGSRLSGDISAGSNSAFNAYTGYVTLLVPTQTNSSSAIITQAKRDKLGTFPLSGGTTTTMTGRTGPTQSAANSMQSGVTYTFEATFTRISNSDVQIDISLTGGTLSNYWSQWTDSTSSYTSFDTLIIGSTNATTFSSFTLHEVTVSQIIPEPGSIHLLLPGLILLLGAARYRRR